MRNMGDFEQALHEAEENYFYADTPEDRRHYASEIWEAIKSLKSVGAPSSNA